MNEQNELIKDMESTSVGLGFSDDKFTMEMIIQNPILKPIAEKNATLAAIEKMATSKISSAIDKKKYLNAALDDVPAYRDSTFVNQLLNYKEDVDDIVRMQDIEIKLMKSLIKEMVEMVEKSYRVHTATKHKEAVEVKKEVFDYKAYLKGLLEHEDPAIAAVADKIYNLYILDMAAGRTDEQKFASSCAAYYKTQKDDEKRKVSAMIIKREIPVKGGAK